VQLAERVALVTGAAMGIGEGIAQRFLDEGAGVALFDWNSQALRDTAQRLSASGSVIAIEGDVSLESDVVRAIRCTLDTFGRLDILVNNAGIDLAGKVTELTATDWDRLLGVNLKGTFLFAKHSMAELERNRGNIVNISSVHALVSFEACPAYDAAKAGLLALTRTLALDHGPAGVRVNAICPGYILTPMTEKWFASVPDRATTEEQVRNLHPLRRLGTPRDIAEAALFLASDAASFISGATIVVDGGLTIYGR
jgi:NAD(P)-dependent dehydrogenase (short-subunit alcohol dehydrogenase family)